jgi:hypothetical protein
MKALLACVVALLATGCGSDAIETPTSSTPTTATATTVTFAGSLAPRASRFYSFTSLAGGSVSVMLASVAPLAGGAPLSTRLGLGLGVPSGTGCALEQSVSAASGLTAQLQHSISAGVHCVSVFDEGSMTEPVYFAIRFSHP